MDYFIMGTAGHIDHGKTALIKALTGINTDRFKEEKERGISIDIGFAPLELSNGRRIGIVDVPGHERFIRNMLAGAGGMDFILFVVDAREGVMPQTLEHLAILELLNIQHGIIVVTKVDLVDEEWLLFLHQELQAEFAGSFLENAPIVDVSSVTLQGIDKLKHTIEEQLPQVQSKSVSGTFRLPVDRSFTVQGIGTVVTGTVWRGEVRVGDSLHLLPDEVSLRVRSIQVHGENKEVAFAGQRVALALGGIKNEVHRGMILTSADSYHLSRLVDVRIQLLKSVNHVLRHRERIRFYLGTAEVFGRVLLLHGLELNPGEDALAQILFESVVVTEPKDRFVLRSYSPMQTIAGGTVISADPERIYRRNNKDIEGSLLRKERGTLSERLLSLLTKKQDTPIDELSSMLGEPVESILQNIDNMEKTGELVSLGQNAHWIPEPVINKWEAMIRESVLSYYRKNPYDIWVPKSILNGELREFGIDSKGVEALIARIQQQSGIVVEADRLKMWDREVNLLPDEKIIYDQVITLFLGQLFSPPSKEELEQLLNLKGRDKALKNVLHLMIQQGEIVAISQDIYMAQTAVHQAALSAENLFLQKGAFSVAEFRDLLLTSRKYAVVILEYFDRQKWTRRTGDVRNWMRKIAMKVEE